MFVLKINPRFYRGREKASVKKERASYKQAQGLKKIKPPSKMVKVWRPHYQGTRR